MKSWFWKWVILASALIAAAADTNGPAAQRFEQEVATGFTARDGLPAGPVQLIQALPEQPVRAFVQGQWHELVSGRWQAISDVKAEVDEEFVFLDSAGRKRKVGLPWHEVKQLICIGLTNYIATSGDPFIVVDGMLSSLSWPSRYRVNQIAVAPEGMLWLASSAGLFRQTVAGWIPIQIFDSGGRAWAARDVLGVDFDLHGQAWFATKAGVGCLTPKGWQFYEGKDGLPWNDFTGVSADAEGGIWFGTHLGAIHFDGKEWAYRQGPTWLPHDDVGGIAARSKEGWFATAGGVGHIQRLPMTLRAKAALYEDEIERFIKRTPYGYVAEAYLRKPADKTTADPQDSDNDGLWTAMYGAGECFAYGATKDPKAKARAKQAFEALSFLQKVTQTGEHAPPKGYIARTIRSASWPDPNAGRLERDRQEQKRDRLWKVYEPRWPKSGDGKWYWKSDTSSDELDGHFFFYALFYDLCAETDEEKEDVGEVVRDITDHLLTHGFALIDHDGKPTRWAVYGPQFLNQNPLWWPERGLNSLSILSYLAVAAHVTGDAKYEAASRELTERHGYAHNIMYPKVQQGPGSGNQSDDEMAFMCYYSLLRCSKDETLKGMARYSFFRYWVNEAPEMNPFFNFCYASQNREASVTNVWGSVSVQPWAGWQSDAMATLYGFPLDRLNWPHRNSHRLDIVPLGRARSSDLDTPDRPVRGARIHGKVLPVENRHFNHWNTDPWELDYGGNGGELAAGTVFLLPYYMGLYHGFIEVK